MRATIVHESRGRLRLRLRQKNLTLRQADLLETWLKGQPWVGKPLSMSAQAVSS